LVVEPIEVSRGQEGLIKQVGPFFRSPIAGRGQLSMTMR
jgi:hypothetical protein